MKIFLYKPKLQTFYRRIDNMTYTVTSVTCVYGNGILSRPISLLADQHIMELLLYLDNRKISIDELEYICGTEYIPWAFTNIERIKTPVFFMTQPPCYEMRREFTKNELINLKYMPDYYTENEEKIISELNYNSFFQWFKNDINIILKYTLGFKKSNIEFEFPKNINEVKRIPYISSTLSVEKLEKELEGLYQRTIIILSLIFIEDLTLIKIRKKLMNEVRFLKQLMYAITEELDRNFVRVRNFVFNYKTMDRKVPYYENFLQPLVDILRKYEFEIDSLKNEASSYFNFLYS